MTDRLFRMRMNEDVARRSHYGKFIFNSHFLIFLSIAIGFFLYSLLSLVQTLTPSFWLNVIISFVLGITLLPSYRTLFKQADGIFLLAYEAQLKDYLRAVDRYSLTLGLWRPVAGGVVALILMTAGHPAIEIIIALLASVFFYVMNFMIRKEIINSEWPVLPVSFGLIALTILSLILILTEPILIVLPFIVYALLLLFAKKHSHASMDWRKLIGYEEEQLNKYYQTVSLFTNVSHIDKQFKRRRYLDPLLWKPKEASFNKEKMYEYLFYRTFARDHDLPMIVLRLLVLFGVVMVWIANLYLSVVIALFGIYIIVLQMSQIYTAQAYLLWPKVWPVDRSYIQKSYVTYSHKLVFVIALIFSILFISIHPGYFYLGIMFPLWGYIINRSLSRAVYRKEKELSD
ncbi:ABC transporter permease [Salinicoccus jeotgali]|uniref:ABC transporter permease n=1 Tax=Salinicoccus jeotgali TaxID=381634 RepID=A0ABP7EQ98_9STAP